MPLIVCPKSVKTAWRNVAAGLDIPILDICNIEQLKTGKTPYLAKAGKSFKWTLPTETFIIWDEVQNASGYKTQNAQILALTKAYGFTVLMLSATVADSPKKLQAPGYLLDLHNFKDHYNWCLNHGCYKNSWNGLDFVTGSQRREHLIKIHNAIFPNRGTRVCIENLGDVFPDNKVTADVYDFDEYTDEINEIYATLDAELQNPDSAENPLTKILRARQQIELYKVPLLFDMIEDLLDEDKSVVAFVSFRETLSKLESQLASMHRVSLIYGGQNGNERDDNIALFQNDERRIMLAMIQAGGVGISLHDMNGQHPRASLLTPTYNAVELKQALGRIHRAGGKSKCIQKILFAAGTVEEKACRAVRRKLSNIDLLNNGDLTKGTSI